jgi:hypothetical protein
LVALLSREKPRFPTAFVGASLYRSRAFALLGMVLLMACCTSWSETVRSKTASIVETVTTEKAMVNAFLDVVGGDGLHAEYALVKGAEITCQNLDAFCVRLPGLGFNAYS